MAADEHLGEYFSSIDNGNRFCFMYMVNIDVDSVQFCVTWCCMKISDNEFVYDVVVVLYIGLLNYQ